MSDSGLNQNPPTINLSEPQAPPKPQKNLEFQHLQDNNKKSNFLVILSIIIIISVLTILGYFGFIFFKNKVLSLSSINANKIDSDGDGLALEQEAQNGTDPNKPDSDYDGMPDGWEVKYGLNPNDYLDATKDNDKDGLTNLQEFQYGTDPNDTDTDSDKFKDADEVKNGYNPNGNGKLIK